MVQTYICHLFVNIFSDTHIGRYMWIILINRYSRWYKIVVGWSNTIRRVESLMKLSIVNFRKWSVNVGRIFLLCCTMFLILLSCGTITFVFGSCVLELVWWTGEFWSKLGNSLQYISSVWWKLMLMFWDSFSCFPWLQN